MNSNYTETDITPKTGRILIVDDEEIVHQTIKRLLNSKGYTIDSAFGGNECLSKLEAGYDLLICDIRMPDLDGIEVLKEIRKRELDVEVVMLTGYASLESATHAMNYGARGYLMKPIENISEFRNLVSEAVHMAQLARENKQFYEALTSGEIDSLIIDGKPQPTPAFREDVKDILGHLLQVIRDGFVILDFDGNITYSNVNFAQMIGESYMNLMGTGFESYLSEGENEKIIEALTQLSGGQSAANIQTNLLTTFNRRLSVNISFAPIHHQMEYMGTAMVISDITEISRVREKVELLANLVENAQYDMMFIVQPNGQIIECNAAVRNTFGYSQSEILSQNIEFLIRSENGGDWKTIVDGIKLDSSWRGEIVAICKDGKEFSIEMTLSRSLSKTTNSENIICFMRDITERKHADARLELERKKEYLDQLIKVSPIAILALDLKGIITVANRNASELLGYENDELIGISASQLLVDEDVLKLADRKGFSVDFMKKDGKLNPMNVSTSLLTENDKSVGMIVTIQDMSELQGLFITPSTEDIVEIETDITFEPEPSYMYLIDSEDFKMEFNVFSNLVKQGKSGLCITRENPEKLKKSYGLSKTPIVWLTKNRIPNQLIIDPTDIFKLQPTIANFVKEASNGVVLLDGLEYLILENDFISVMKTIEQVNDVIMASTSILILQIDSKAFDSKEYHILKRWMKDLPIPVTDDKTPYVE